MVLDWAIQQEQTYHGPFSCRSGSDGKDVRRPVASEWLLSTEVSPLGVHLLFLSLRRDSSLLAPPGLKGSEIS